MLKRTTHMIKVINKKTKVCVYVESTGLMYDSNIKASYIKQNLRKEFNDDVYSIEVEEA